jgi:hypothetical protein
MTLLGTREKNFYFHFKRNYLTIRAVKFCEIFCTCSPSSPGQDPTVESTKKKIKNSFRLFQQEMAILGCFLRNKGLSWRPTCSCLVHVGALKLAPDMLAHGTLETLFPLKVLVPCEKCSWFKIVIMIFWKGWRSPTPLKTPETHLTMCDLHVTHFMCARNSLFNTMYTTTPMPL